MGCARRSIPAFVARGAHERAPLLEIDGLTVDYATPNGPLRAVNGTSLQVAQGETLALVGESGSGKSTIAAAIVDLLRNEAATITGRLVFKGRDIASRERRGTSRPATASISASCSRIRSPRSTRA